MESRRLGVGDILDDYCPRERRITNHAIVAMISDEVRQTRCLTCEAEHVYKEAKVPPRRKKKDSVPALYEQVLEAQPPPEPHLAKDKNMEPRNLPADPDAPPAPAIESDEIPAESSAPAPQDEGPVRRSLIRATLPRHEGQPPARPTPAFTVRQPTGRNGQRFDARRPARTQNGNRWSEGAGRFSTGNGRSARAAGGSAPRGQRFPGPRPARPGQPQRAEKKNRRK